MGSYEIVPYTYAVDGGEEDEYIVDIADSVRAVERLLNYQFKDKKLLEEALTHSSYTDSASYQRLEFIGDAALGLAISNFVFLAYPDLDPGQLSLLRAANISTEKLARVAVRHGLHRYVRHNAAALDEKEQPQPVTMLFELCQKDGKHVDIRHWRKGEKNIASVYVDGKFITSRSSEQKENAKLHAAKAALDKLSHGKSNDKMSVDIYCGSSGTNEIEGAKQKLHELCGKKRWPKPSYRIEREVGPAHERKFICSVQMGTVDGVLFVAGDEKSRVKDAENSAASLMIRGLQESKYTNI
ncbi:ribonuclease 3-like protein 2 isoform X4 [Camellia sinensis]|uniref:ribonuclease 3-like protein 2 isoform X4 n=1 Tax=Camellia sinensis TaxID=4442 RepID=UPI00103663BF|nr:ribonuclease 3-like protein 2 isoform X4 [Camellia sinensis]